MLPRIRLLYAEDNPQDADLTRTHFSREAPDIDLEVADTGEKFLRWAGELPFDVFLLDNQLPDLNGIDVLQALNQTGCQVPVIMVTGVGDAETVIQTLRLGACEYVPKRAGYLTTLPEVVRTIARQQQEHCLNRPVIGSAVRRVLYVEHHPMDVDLTLRHLAQSAPHLALQVVISSEEALQLLAGQPPFDLVLVDLRMPEMGALDLLQVARHRSIPVPFIVITGMGDEAAAVAALKLGAYDYLIKRENYLLQLPNAIENAIHRYELDQGSRRLQKELQELNMALESKVQERTLQLEATSARLRILSRKLIEIQEQERRHLARELHDEIGQVLCAVNINLQAVRHHVDSASWPRLDESIGIVTQSINQVRNLSLDLHPSILDDSGLAAALRWLIQRWTERTGLVAEVAMTSVGIDLPFEVRNACFRVAQEALTNVVRHAHARHVWLELHQRSELLTLIVRDDGQGFDVKAARQRAVQGNSLGLLGMLERIGLLGGTVEIDSQVGQGTTVRVRLPLLDPEAPEAAEAPETETGAPAGKHESNGESAFDQQQG